MNKRIESDFAGAPAEEIEDSIEGMQEDSPEQLIADLQRQIEQISIRDSATPDETKEALTDLERLRQSIRNLGKSKEAGSLEDSVIDEMVRELGDDWQEKMDEFKRSLSPSETILVQSIMTGTVPDMRHAVQGFSFKDADIYTKVIKVDFRTRFREIASHITRGIGATVRDPETNERVKVTANNYSEYGPRALWMKEWEQVFESLQRKVDELENRT